MARVKTVTWLTTKQAENAFNISRNHLGGLRKDGTLKPGKHYRDVRRKDSMKASYRYSLEDCEELFNAKPEMRK